MSKYTMRESSKTWSCDAGATKKELLLHYSEVYAGSLIVKGRISFYIFRSCLFHIRAEEQNYVLAVNIKFAQFN